MHILSPETDNCPSWISGWERMTVENISWSISTKECYRPRLGLNPWPSGLQSDGASNHWLWQFGVYWTRSLWPMALTVWYSIGHKTVWLISQFARKVYPFPMQLCKLFASHLHGTCKCLTWQSCELCRILWVTLRNFMHDIYNNGFFS